MRPVLLPILLMFTTQCIIGQKNNGVNLVLGAGASYFFNDNSINRRVNPTGSVGFNYTIHNKHQTLMFCPALNIYFNRYRSRINESQIITVAQNLIKLDLDVLMRLSKKSLLRMGLYFSGVSYSSVFISYTNYNTQYYYYSYGNSELEKEYSPTTLQAGVTVGLSFLFKLFKRENKFNIKLIQNVSSVVNSEYTFSEKMIGKDIRVLSGKSKPTMLTLGFDFSLKKKKKKNVEEEE